VLKLGTDWISHLEQPLRRRHAKSMMGSGGGALLARPGDQISLLDVYRAVDEEGTLLALHEQPNAARWAEASTRCWRTR
jgi:DNA-binding IscR family transcriptional regulator